MADPLRIRTTNELDGLLVRSEQQTLVLFKHSTRCPISTRALEEYLAFLEQAPATLAAIVYVVEDRPLSNHIATRLGVTHESPQCFLIGSGKVLWHDSHERVTAARIAEQMATVG